MTHEEQAHEAALNFMELIEQIDAVVEVSTAIPDLPFEYLTPELWETIQLQQGATCELFATMRQMIQMSTKVLYNEDVINHLTAVISADQ